MAGSDPLEGLTPEMFNQTPVEPSANPLEGLTPEMFNASNKESRVSRIADNVLTGVDKIADVGRAAVSVPWNIATGITELGAGVLDTIFDTDTLNDVSAFMERAGKPYEPKYTVGQVTEVGGEIGAALIPAFFFLRTASQASRLANAGKAVEPAKSLFGRAAQSYGKSKTGRALTANNASRFSQLAASSLPVTAATGVGTFMFSPDGRPTLSTTIEEIPLPFTDAAIPLDWLYTEEDTGLTGRDNAERFFKNRLKKASEQALLSVGVDLGLYGAGTVARTAPVRGVVRGGVTTAKKTADFVKDSAEYAGTQVAQNAVVQDLMGSSFGKALSTKVKPLAPAAKKKLVTWFTPDGGADPFVSQMLRDTIDMKDSLVRPGIQAMDEFHEATGSVLKATRFLKRSRPGATALRNDLEKRLRGFTTPEEFTSAYGAKAEKAAQKMVDAKQNLIDRNVAQLELEIERAPVGSDKRRKAEEALEIIRQSDEAGIGYLRRVFEAKENPVAFLNRLEKEGFTLNHPLYNKAIKEVSNVLGTLDETRGLAPEVIRKQAQELVNNTAGLSALNSPGVDVGKVLKDAIESIKEGRTKRGFLTADTPKLSIKEDFLISRKPILEESDSLREFLGEITDPEEMYTRTMSDLSESWAANEFYGKLAVDQGVAPRLTRALELIQNGGRPQIVMMPSPEDISARNKLMVTLGNDTRTVQEALDANDPTRAALLEIRDRLGTNNISDELKFMEDAVTVLEQRNYVPLAGLAKDEAEGFSTIFGGQFGRLQNAYVTPEMYRAMKQALNLSPLNDVAAIMQQIRSFSQRMTIVPSLPGQIRNLLGNMSMLVSNGNTHRGTNLIDNFYLLTQSLVNVDDDGLRRLAKIANQSGLMDSNAVYKTLKEYQQFGRETSKGQAVGKALDRAEDFIPFMKTFDKLYGGQDAFFKLLAFNGEYNKYSKAFAKSGFREDNPLLLGSLQDAGIFARSTRTLEDLSVLEEGAANLVKKTMPMYNMIPQALRFVDRIPVVGNFTSFASENIRNIFNIADLGMREVSFKVPPGKVDALIAQEATKGIPKDEVLRAVSEFEKAVQSNGSQRLVNTMVVVNTVPQQLTRLSMKLTGTTQEELDALESSVQPYMKGGDLMIIDNDHKGNITFVDTSYHNPWGYIRSAVRAALQSYTERGELDQGEAQKLLEGSLATFITKMAEPFASETMMTERILDVTLREGRTKTGSYVYDKNRTDEKLLGDRGSKIFLHLAEGMIPRYWLEFYEEKGGELKKGKTLKALTGEPSASGRFSLPEAEFARMLTGLTPMTHTATDAIKFDAIKYADGRNASLSAVKRIVRAGDTTREQKTQEFADLIEAYRAQQNELYVNIENARILGASTRDIIRALVEDANMSSAEANQIARGRLYVKPLSEDLVNSIERRKKENDFQSISDLPYDEMFRMVRESIDSPLATISKRKAEGTFVPSRMRDALVGTNPLEGLTPDMFNQAPNPLEGLTPDMFNQAPVTPAAPPVSAPQGRVDPAILGNDPATQALAKSLGRSQ